MPQMVRNLSIRSKLVALLVVPAAGTGLLTVQQPARGDAGERPGRALLERVLDGLRAI